VGWREALKSLAHEIGEERLDDGATPHAVQVIEDGRGANGETLITRQGNLALQKGEGQLFRGDFSRLGVAVLYAPAITTATRTALLDLDKNADLIVTSGRVVVIVDDLSTKGGWSGGGLGVLAAATFNVAHRVGSKIRHSGRSMLVQVPIASLNRVLAPNVPTFEWSAAGRSMTFGWQEPRNLGVGDLRVVLLDQRHEDDHIVAAKTLAFALGSDQSGPFVDIRR
jgi:hypothetical protein